MIEYPDPTKNEQGKWCDDFDARTGRAFVPNIAPVFGFGIGSNEAKWAHENIVTKLNCALETVVKKNAGGAAAWRYVGGIAYQSRKSGYCSKKDSWFITYTESEKKQGLVLSVAAGDSGGVPTGAMHPNIISHYSVAAEIETLFQDDGLMARGPGKRDEIPTNCRPGQ